MTGLFELILGCWRTNLSHLNITQLFKITFTFSMNMQNWSSIPPLLHEEQNIFYFILNTADGLSIICEFMHQFTVVIISLLSSSACWLLRLSALLWSPSATLASRSPDLVASFAEEPPSPLVPLSRQFSLRSHCQTSDASQPCSSLPRLGGIRNVPKDALFPLILTTFYCLQKWAQSFLNFSFAPWHSFFRCRMLHLFLCCSSSCKRPWACSHDRAPGFENWPVIGRFNGFGNRIATRLRGSLCCCCSPSPVY